MMPAIKVRNIPSTMSHAVRLPNQHKHAEALQGNVSCRCPPNTTIWLVKQEVVVCVLVSVRALCSRRRVILRK